MSTPQQPPATVIVHDRTPEGLARIHDTIRGMPQFKPIVEQWLAMPEQAFLLICLDGAVPVKAFSMEAKDEANLYSRVLGDAASMMPIDALRTSQIAAVSRDLNVKCDVVWQTIVANRLASRGGAH